MRLYLLVFKANQKQPFQMFSAIMSGSHKTAQHNYYWIVVPKFSISPIPLLVCGYDNYLADQVSDPVQRQAIQNRFGLRPISSRPSSPARRCNQTRFANISNFFHRSPPCHIATETKPATVELIISTEFSIELNKPYAA
jgi:hypothetical protein